MSTVCVTCLSKDRRLTPVKNVFIYTDIWSDIILNLTDRVCWLCKAMLMKLSRFHQRVKAAQNILYSNSNTHQNTVQNSDFYNLKQSPITFTNFEIKTYDDTILQVKEEIEESDDFTPNYVEVGEKDDMKEELDKAEQLMLKQKSLNVFYNEQPLNLEENYSVEEQQSVEFQESIVKNKNLDEEYCKKERNVDMVLMEKEKEFLIKRMTEEEVLEARERDRNCTKYNRYSFKCESCILGFSSKKYYEKHQSDCHSNKAGPLLCRICECRFANEQLLRAHFDRHYVRYECKICKAQRFNLNVMVAHYRSQHLSRTCQYCGETFISFRRLRYHIDKNHKEPAVCRICKQKLSSATALKIHMGRHTKEKPLECDICHRFYKNEFTLAAHVRQNHKSKCHPEDYYCAECDIQFASMANYKAHLTKTSKHSNAYKFECSECGRKFFDKTSVKHHLGKHFTYLRVSFPCEYCKRVFYKKSELKSHVKYKHEGAVRPRKYVCSYCNKGFMESLILKHHMRIHTGEKPYECQLCPWKFAQKSTLVTHVKGVHMKMFRKDKS